MNRDWNGVNQKEIKYDKSKSDPPYFELISKPNFDTMGIKLSMRKQHNFETILTSNDVTNIKYYIEKWFGSWERILSKKVNYYFGSIRKNRPHKTLNYEPEKSKFEIDYCRQKHCFPEKWIIHEECMEKRSRSNILFKIF